MQEGAELPKAIKNAPILLPGLQMFMEAFERLNTGRPVGFGGLGRISWRDIQEYCDRTGITDEEQRDDMEYQINALDAAYLDWWESTNKKGR